ncbi:unnamed protein product [Brachionus calyciflorus]|uniref:Uncharacterized protein n=1 Tax=Brachionus calyciflorus TaxID=104777 RepID=A0A813QXY6_9BILA|nr:unnamed protein product [Brachionus calyciflorus]
MSKTKAKALTTSINSTKLSTTNNNETILENSSLNFNQNSFTLESSIGSNNTSKKQRKASATKTPSMKKRQTNANMYFHKENFSIENSLNESDFTKTSQILPSYYCININQDGYPNMDKTSHINDEEIENKRLEFQLRPISGIRNHLKRNESNNNKSIDITKDTDIFQRIGSVKTLKRLDLSFNNLDNYPRQLCDLSLLESLNLTGNKLNENDLPSELDRYHNLIELILDKNNFKRIPKILSKFKKLQRLSLKNNELIELKNVEYFKKLKYLIVDYNNLASVDDSVRVLDKLEILYMSHNSIQQIDSSLFKSSLHNLKQLDLSFNKLERITTELLMLPHLESLNLSNNLLTRLPSLSATFFRAQPLFRFDLSSNRLCRFYDYLLSISKHLDLSSNRLKQIPSKAVLRLTDKQVQTKTLKLENNILVEPRQEICNSGLKAIKEYFEEEHEKLIFNKGFKIIIVGEPKSGKTSLSYALEDINSQSNLIEQYNDAEDTESKFIEIHQFYMNTELDDTQRPSSAVSIQSVNQENKYANSSKSFKILSSKKPKQSEELNAFSNSSFYYYVDPLSSRSEITVKKSVLPVTIYDFNGNFTQFGHLSNLFLDKKALLIICLDSTSLSQSQENFQKNLNNLLDHIFLKMSKNQPFSIIPVLTKIDTCIQNKTSLCEQTGQFIKQHLQHRLNQIKEDLKLIEKLPQISASQSDRLKQLVQTQANLNPEIYQNCIGVSSLKMDGINQLNLAIKQIVYNNKKTFALVNTKIPSFWIEVEKYATQSLSEIPNLKYYEDKIKILSQSSMSILCLDYSEYRSKIVERYGMSHLVEQITDYLSSSGSIIWFHENEKMKKKVFLRPNIFYEMLFVLFRGNFHENFDDVHRHSVRSKLIQNSVNMSQENIENLSSEFLTKGLLQIDLLKMLWYPVLITDSQTILQDVVVLFADMFNLFYPAVSKEKIKILMNNNKSDFEQTMNDSIYSSFYINPITQSYKNEVVNFNSIIVPFYLPYLSEQAYLSKIRKSLQTECINAAKNVVNIGIKKSKPLFMSRISQKYTFPWGLMCGIFEKFSVNCILNSDLYYKNHFKNFIYGYNEDNSIGVIIYTNALKKTDECNEVIFDFYLVNYQSVIDGLDPSNKNEFDQTTEMDLDQIWLVALKILQYFEETISQTYPSLRYDRWSLCPECEKYTFYGEWMTPKELQKIKSKVCPVCEKIVHYSFLVRPSTGQSLTLDMKRMQQRLERLARLDPIKLSLNTSQPKNETKSAISSESTSKIRNTKII